MGRSKSTGHPNSIHGELESKRSVGRLEYHAKDKAARGKRHREQLNDRLVVVLCLDAQRHGRFGVVLILHATTERHAKARQLSAVSGWPRIRIATGKISAKMKKLSGLTVLLLAACSSSTGAWVADGAVGGIDRDTGQCLTQAKMVPATGNAVTDDDNRNDFFRDCMHRKGWKESR
jgi:hypothetical protein